MEIKEIPYKIGMPLIITNHYLHRKCSCTVCFGLYVRESLKGV